MKISCDSHTSLCLQSRVVQNRLMGEKLCAFLSIDRNIQVPGRRQEKRVSSCSSAGESVTKYFRLLLSLFFFYKRSSVIPLSLYHLCFGKTFFLCHQRKWCDNKTQQIKSPASKKRLWFYSYGQKIKHI